MCVARAVVACCDLPLFHCESSGGSSCAPKERRSEWVGRASWERSEEGLSLINKRGPLQRSISVNGFIEAIIYLVSLKIVAYFRRHVAFMFAYVNRL
jgi:hypothetical protein